MLPVSKKQKTADSALSETIMDAEEDEDDERVEVSGGLVIAVIVAAHADRKHKCPWVGCSKAYSKAASLRRHHRSHSSVKPYSCGYPHCTHPPFSQKLSTLAHICQVHCVLSFKVAGNYLKVNQEVLAAEARQLGIRTPNCKAINGRSKDDDDDDSTLSTDSEEESPAVELPADGGERSYQCTVEPATCQYRSPRRNNVRRHVRGKHRTQFEAALVDGLSGAAAAVNDDRLVDWTAFMTQNNGKRFENCDREQQQQQQQVLFPCLVEGCSVKMARKKDVLKHMEAQH